MLFKQLLLAGALQAALATAVNVDVDYQGPSDRETGVERFLRNHPPGNRTHGGHDNVDVNVDHQHGSHNANVTVDHQHHDNDNTNVDVNHKPGQTNVNIDHKHHNETNPYGGNNIQTRDLGTAVIGNRCPYDIWVWSVDQNSSNGPIKVPSRSKYEEPFRSPCDGCGVSFKVSTTDQLEGGKQTQFEYAISGGQVWYDISFVDCAQGESADNCPGHDKGVAMDSPEPACGAINCAGGSYCPTQAYYVDTPVSKLGLPEPVFGCGTAGTGMTLYMKTCSDEAPLKRSIAGRMAIDDEV